MQSLKWEFHMYLRSITIALLSHHFPIGISQALQIDPNPPSLSALGELMPVGEIWIKANQKAD